MLDILPMAHLHYDALERREPSRGTIAPRVGCRSRLSDSSIAPPTLDL